MLWAFPLIEAVVLSAHTAQALATACPEARERLVYAPITNAIV